MAVDQVVDGSAQTLQEERVELRVHLEEGPAG